jgi:hypothetical protein
LYKGNQKKDKEFYKIFIKMFVVMRRVTIFVSQYNGKEFKKLQKIKIMTTLTTLSEIKKIKTFSTREKFEIKGNVIFFDVDNWTWRAKNIFGFGFASHDDLKKLLKYVLENK